MSLREKLNRTLAEFAQHVTAKKRDDMLKAIITTVEFATEHPEYEINLLDEENDQCP